MLHTPRHRPFVVGTVLLLSLAIAAPRVHADWDDRSGSLPGISGIGSVVLLAAAGVGALFLMRHFGQGSALRATPARLDFDTSSTAGAVTLRNSSGTPLRVVGVDLPTRDAFHLQPLAVDLPAVLDRDQSMTVSVGFVPGATGKYSTTLSVTTIDSRNKTRRLQIKVNGVAKVVESVSVPPR